MSNIKNGLKVKQLAKKPPTLKTLINAKNFGIGLWVKSFTFLILSSLKLNFSNFFLARDNLIVNNIVFKEDTGNIRKVSNLDILKKKRKLEFKMSKNFSAWTKFDP